MQHGSVTELDQIAFPPETLRTTAFDIVADSIFEYQDVGPDSRRIALYIHNDFREGTVLLDGSYFAGNSFKNCLVVYHGGNTIFAPDQDVTTSILKLGKMWIHAPSQRLT